MMRTTSRREWLTMLAGLLPVTIVQPSRPAAGTAFATAVRAIELKVGGRLGAAFWDTHDGRRGRYRGTERFAMCSTFKLLAVAAVLDRVDRGAERLNRVVRYGADRVLAYAPVTSKHVNDGLSVAALCAAAIEQSDNTAGNLLLDIIGGPSGLTSYLRRLGDTVTRLDRIEPMLNSAEPGDPRDTTSPVAMLETMHHLLVERHALRDASRHRLEGWLVSSATGGARLRAALPSTWRVGDKTGTGEHAAANDVAIAWPPNRKAVIITVFSTESPRKLDERNSAIADVGRAVLNSRR